MHSCLFSNDAISRVNCCLYWDFRGFHLIFEVYCSLNAHHEDFFEEKLKESLQIHFQRYLASD